MSDPPRGWRELPASRARRRWLLLGAGALAALAPVLAHAPAAPAARLGGLACAAAAAALLHAALRPCGAARCAGPDAGDAHAGAPGLTPGAPIAEYVGTGRIVLRGTRGRIVVWRDAVEPAAYRRLAVAARWPYRGGSR